jgi:hypothetical protein
MGRMRAVAIQGVSWFSSSFTADLVCRMGKLSLPHEQLDVDTPAERLDVDLVCKWVAR